MKSLADILNKRQNRWHEIAKMAGVAYTTVSRTARGDTVPLSTTAERIMVAAKMHRPDK